MQKVEQRVGLVVCRRGGVDLWLGRRRDRGEGMLQVQGGLLYLEEVLSLRVDRLGEVHLDLGH